MVFMEQSNSDPRYDVVITLIYAVTIGINVYIAIDQMTDGGLTRSVERRIESFRTKLANRQQLKRESSRVVWEAITIVEGNS